MQGPTLSVTFSVGDPSITPMQWSAGVMSIGHRNGRDLVAEPAVSSHEEMFTVQPSLSHTFRPERQQPPAMIPLLATAVVAVPLFCLLFALVAHLGVNLSGLTQAGALHAALSAVFLACIGSALGLGVVFWLKLRLVDLFVPLGSLSVLTILVGHQTLSRMADLRLESQKCKAE
jgi:hypothetical protein